MFRGLDALTMRPGTSTPIGIIPKSMNMHSTLGAGVVARYIPGDLRLGVLGGLLEVDVAFHVGISSENGDCKVESACGGTFGRDLLGRVGWRRCCEWEGEPSRLCCCHFHVLDMQCSVHLWFDGNLDGRSL